MNATTGANGTFMLTDSPSEGMNASFEEAASPSNELSEILPAIDPLLENGGMDMDVVDVDIREASSVSPPSG